MKVIEFNGKEYEIKYTINTLVRMESDGVNVMHMEELINNISFTLVRKLFYYGLMNSVGKSLTENKAGDMMDEYLEKHDYRELMTVLLGELARALGHDVDAKEAEESDDEAGK